MQLLNTAVYCCYSQWNWFQGNSGSFPGDTSGVTPLGTFSTAHSHSRKLAAAGTLQRNPVIDSIKLYFIDMCQTDAMITSLYLSLLLFPSRNYLNAIPLGTLCICTPLLCVELVFFYSILPFNFNTIVGWSSPSLLLAESTLHQCRDLLLTHQLIYGTRPEPPRAPTLRHTPLDISTREEPFLRPSRCTPFQTMNRTGIVGALLVGTSFMNAVFIHLGLAHQHQPELVLRQRCVQRKT